MQHETTMDISPVIIASKIMFMGKFRLQQQVKQHENAHIGILFEDKILENVLQQKFKWILTRQRLRELGHFLWKNSLIPDWKR